MTRWGWVLGVLFFMTAGVSEAQFKPVADEPAAETPAAPPASEDTWHRSDGNFGAMLIVTDQYASFVRTWAQPPKEGEGPAITLADSAVRGDEVAAVLTFSQCTPGITGKCRCDADFTVVRPDGSTYATHKKIEVWSSAPPPEEAAQLSIGRLKFRIEPDDPLGTYQIRAVVRDLVAKREVALEWPLTVKEETWSPGQKQDWPMAVRAEPVADSPFLSPQS